MTNFTDFGLCLIPNYELKAEILRLGSACEVISPEWLRLELKSEVAKMNERYLSN